MSLNNILLIRTFQDFGSGGPVPPVSLLQIASDLYRSDTNYNIKLLDTGLLKNPVRIIKEEIYNNKINVILFNSLPEEANYLHFLANIIKQINKEILIAVEGKLASIAEKSILLDNNIDYVFYGEVCSAFKDLLLIDKNSRNSIKNLIYRYKSGIVKNKRNDFESDLENCVIVEKAWNLIDLNEYSKRLSWNGITFKNRYIPIITSKGCPFNCSFCVNSSISGKIFHGRSAERVLTEIKFLKERYQINEFHIYDYVFNYDLSRAKKILRLIIENNLNVFLAFPHGLRIDLIDDEFISLLKKAGTYKVVFGLESGSSVMQDKIKKNFDLNKARQIILKMEKIGIMTAGYFILGLPDETESQIVQTIDFAVNSKLSMGYFFKYIDYNLFLLNYSKWLTSNFEGGFNAADFTYFSANSPEKDNMMLNYYQAMAQFKFYFSFRIFKNFIKTRHKLKFIKMSLEMMTKILYGYLVNSLFYGVKNG